jgi:hypothetical protein
MVVVQDQKLLVTQVLKHNYSSTQKIMAKSIERGVQLLMDSIDCMQARTHETSFALEGKKD